MATPLRASEGRRARQGHGRLSQMGAHRRPEIRAVARLRAAAAAGGRQRNAGARQDSMTRSSDDRSFRIGTGAFAALVLLIVSGIAFELTRQSTLAFV